MRAGSVRNASCPYGERKRSSRQRGPRSAASASRDSTGTKRSSSIATTTLVAVEQDQLVPVQDLVALAEALPALRKLKLLRSAFGHDAFLKETDTIARTLAEALAWRAGGAA